MHFFTLLCCGIMMNTYVAKTIRPASPIAVQVREATAAYRNTLNKKNHPVSPQDMVDVASEIPTIILDLKYATDDNFTGKAVYAQARCFLRRAVVEKLKKVQAALQKQGLGLKIWDGYRPYSVQQIFWDRCP
ncbi:hypothetical protein EBZ39_10510, partial [bacterium]|nr:hypothetical protein [bacterium]